MDAEPQAQGEGAEPAADQCGSEGEDLHCDVIHHAASITVDHAQAARITPRPRWPSAKLVAEPMVNTPKNTPK